MLKGVVLDDGPLPIRVCTSRARRMDGTYEVDVELRSAGAGGKITLHARGRALLAETLSSAPAIELPASLRETTCARSTDALYADVLFHGTHFHALERVKCINRDGMAAEVLGAPTPAEWLAEPLRSAWLTDPLMVDAGMQLGVLWCHDQLGAVSLPGYVGRYRQFVKTAGAGVTAALLCRETASHQLTGDIVFLDENNVIVAQIEGCEWTADPSLRAAFEQRTLANA